MMPAATENLRDAARIEDLAASLYPWARRLAVFLCRDTDAAQDLVQEAFLRAVAAFRDPVEPATAKAWLRTTMVHVHLKRMRGVSREAKAYARVAMERTPEARLPEPTDRLLNGLAALGRRQRACVVLRYLEDRSEGEIAATLRIRPGTVKAHLAQARERLRTVL